MTVGRTAAAFMHACRKDTTYLSPSLANHPSRRSEKEKGVSMHRARIILFLSLVLLPLSLAFLAIPHAGALPPDGYCEQQYNNCSNSAYQQWLNCTECPLPGYPPGDPRAYECNPLLACHNAYVQNMALCDAQYESCCGG